MKSSLGNKKIFAENLKRFMEKNNVSRSDLGRALDIPYTTLSSWLKAESYPRIDKIEMMARFFHVNKSDLIEPEGSNLITPTVHPIPILGEICCGDGIFTEENFDGYFYIDKSVSADYCLKARGDSMTDAGINAGDLVMIRKSPDFEQGKIYAVHRNGEQLASLKKVYKSDDKHLMLVACNPAYPPEQVDAQEVSIIGRCIGVYKNI